jgi:hypothetical protein
VLNILSVFVNFHPACESHSPYYVSICCLSYSAISFTLFQIRQCFRKIYTENVLLDGFIKFPLNLSNFKKNWQTTMTNAIISYCKIPDMLLRLHRILLFSTRCWEIFKIFILEHFAQWTASFCKQKGSHDAANALISWICELV